MGVIKLHVLVVGDRGVGKSAMCHWFLFREFSEPESTTAPKLYIKGVPLGSNVIEINLVELPADENSHDVRKPYYSLANSVFYCYDVTNPDSLYSILGWSAEAEENGFHGISYIVGLKGDLDSNIEESEVVDIVNELGARHFIVSSKNGEGIISLFANLIKDIMGKRGT
ncbi:MAG: hypothetical protein QXL15_03730 [Candidatus Korarchaeota archaeon]